MKYEIARMREIVAHHRDLALAYLLAGDVPNHGAHASYAREYTLSIKRGA